MKTPVRLLVVEDNPDDLFLLQSALKASAEFEFTVIHVTRAGDACRLLRHERFDAVLTDLSLPNSTGLETIKRLLLDAGGTPVVVISEWADDRMRQEALVGGARACWSKRMVSSPNFAREVGRLAASKDGGPAAA